MSGTVVDGVLIQWGDRLFYPGNRRVRPDHTPRLSAPGSRRAQAIRKRIAATVSRRVPQVMVKVTGGGRGMAAIVAHFRYISKNGRLQMEDDRGIVREGRGDLADLADQWRLGGGLVPEHSHRREAYNLMLSMPRGTDPEAVLEAARAFAKAELKGHRYVMVLHDHQANPHVHLSVKAASTDGRRLNPRKADLQRWRETFAEKMRDLGVEAEATRQATRGRAWRHPDLWEVSAKADGRLRRSAGGAIAGDAADASRRIALEAWGHIGAALAASADPEDRRLAGDIHRFVMESPTFRGMVEAQKVRAPADRPVASPVPSRPSGVPGQPRHEPGPERGGGR